MTKPDDSRVADAVVVGSGAAGAWAAKCLTERGHRTVLLEAGGAPPFADTLEINGGLRLDVERRRLELQRTATRQAIQARCYAFTDDSQDLFVDDLAYPYSVRDGWPYTWVRCRALGGRTNVWNGVLWRMAEEDFSGSEVRPGQDRWPIRYSQLAPHYSRIESFLGVEGTCDGLASVPDGTVSPPRTLAALERAFVGDVSSRPDGLTVVMERCVSGQTTVPGKAPTSNAKAWLDDAVATGRLEIRLQSVVSRLNRRRGRRTVASATVVNAEDKSVTEVHGRAFLLGASTLETTRILLNSQTSDRHGLANSSGVLGHFLTDHLTGIAALGVKHEAPDPTLASQNGLYIPGLRADHRALRFGIQVQAGFPLTERASARPRAGCSLVAFGETIPRSENRVSLDDDLKDELGIPCLRIECRHGPEELASVGHQVSTLRQVLARAGYRPLSVKSRPSEPGSAFHELGTARMGSDPKRSVLNHLSQSWDAPNLFVVDGASFVTPGFQNPTLTMMALADRACEFASRELTAGHL
jgi:choline dehydrogenase-like flavoprotein